MKTSVPALPPDVRQWPKILAYYRNPSLVRSFVEMGVTIVPLFALWFGMWGALRFGAWLCLLLAVPTAGFLVRLFMIQHDCSHGSFFKGRLANDWVGRAIGVVTLTPYDLWKRAHAVHHASVGNLSQRGIGDIATMTLKEYLALGWWGRFWYRVYRNPVIMFGVGPAYLFILQFRLPVGMMRKGWEPWVSTMATNAALVLVVGALIWILGLGPFLLIHLPVAVLAASAGVWLFYVQHQFEHTYWEQDANWAHPEASLHGSSHYALPGILRWFTANIGIHHVHHLNSRIPFYRLPRVLRHHRELADVGKLTLRQSIATVRLTLWDESQHRLISFKEAAQRVSA